MLTLPADIVATFAAFAPLFTRTVFCHVQILLVGAILAPGRRTVASALRAMGLSHEKHFQTYHRVLNRAKWSSRQAAKILLTLLVHTFVPAGPIVAGIDETLERRQGDKIKAKGIYRDAARSSKSFFVKSSGLRWISLMLLAPISWANRVWALPFLTVLAPSGRYDQERHRRHKTLARWAGQMIAQIRRWLPNRDLVIIADSGYAVLTLLARCIHFRNPVTVITRLRLDAALYELLSPRDPDKVTIGRPRKKGKRLPTLQKVLENTATVWQTVTVPHWYGQSERAVEVTSDVCIWYHSGMPPVPIRWLLIRDAQGKFLPQALLCTDMSADPLQIISWFVLRWQLETTFQEVRTHLGVETQRQWSDLAILRTTPALLGLFSLVTLIANQQAKEGTLSVRQAAWYVKAKPTFSDALASVRHQLWSHPNWQETLFHTYPSRAEVQKLTQVFRKAVQALTERFADALCYTV